MERVAEQERSRPLALGHAVAMQLVHAHAELPGAQGHRVLSQAAGSQAMTCSPAAAPLSRTAGACWASVSMSSSRLAR